MNIMAACAIFLASHANAQVYLDTAISLNEKAYSSEAVFGLDNGSVVFEKYLKIKSEVRTEVDISILSDDLETLLERKLSFSGNYEKIASIEKGELVYSIFNAKSQGVKIITTNSIDLSVSVADGKEGLPSIKESEVIIASDRLYYYSKIKKAPNLVELNPINGSFKVTPVVADGYSSKELKLVGVQQSASGEFIWKSIIKSSKGAAALIFITDLNANYIKSYKIESQEGRKLTDINCELRDDIMYVAGAYSDNFMNFQEGVFYGTSSDKGFNLKFEKLTEMPTVPKDFSSYGHKVKKDQLGNKLEGYTVNVNPVFYSSGAVFYFDFYDAIVDTNVSVNYSSSNGTFNNSSTSTFMGYDIKSTVITKFDSTGRVWRESVPFNESIHHDLTSQFSQHYIENDSIFQVYMLGDYSITSAEFDTNGKTQEMQSYGVVDGRLKSWDLWEKGFGLFYAVEDIRKPKGPITKELVSIHFYGNTLQEAIMNAREKEKKDCTEDEVKQLLAGALDEFNDQEAMFQLEMETKVEHLAKVKGWSEEKEAGYGLSLISTPAYKNLFNKKLEKSNELLSLMKRLIDEERSQCEIAEIIRAYLVEGIAINKKEWELVIAKVNEDLGGELKNVKLDNSLSDAELQIVGQYIDLDDSEYGIVFQPNGTVYDLIDGFKTNSRTWKVEDGKLCFLSICLNYKFEQDVLSYVVFGETVRYKRIK